MPHIRFLTLLLALAALALAGCGDDDGDEAVSAEAGSSSGPHLSLPETQTYLERGPLELVRQALGDAPAEVVAELEPEPTDAVRLEAKNSREFDLLVYASPAEAKASWESILDTSVVDEGGSAMRALNVVVLFPKPADDPVYAEVKQQLRTLVRACRSDGRSELRELCFDGEGAVPPAGEGVDSDEVAPLESPVVVEGVRYRPIIARQLNPRIEPDEELVGGRLPDDGKVFFGVVVEACNTLDRPARSTDRITLVSAFGAEDEPVDLPADNPFAYDPGSIDPEDCVPSPDSVAERTIGGRLLLFEIPRDRLNDRPIALRVVSRDGSEQATVGLDL